MHPRRFTGIPATGALLLYGLLSLSGTSVEPDFRKVDPRLLHRDAVATGFARGETTGIASAAGNAIPVFIRLGEDDPDLPGKFLNLGGSAKKVAPRTYVGEIPPETVRYVSNWPKITYIEGSKRVRRMLDLSRPAISADTVQAGTSDFPTPYNTTGLKGDNVYLGFVDTGLYGSHPDFLTSGVGSPSRVVHTYTYSTSIDPLVDVDGHGTHVAGIAAGNGYASDVIYTPPPTYTGMAPNAALMIGKSSFTTTDIVTAVQDLIDFAESQARPVAINLSLGLVVGPHDGTSGFESAINTISTGTSGSRRLIAVAAGNEQDQREHFRTVVGDPFGTRTISLNLLSTLSSPSYPQVEIWAYGAARDPDPAKRTEYDEYTVTVTFPGDNVTVLSGSTLTSSRGLITVSNRVDTSVPNGATHITISLGHSLAGQAGTIRFDRTRNGGTGVIDGYVDYSNGVGDGYFPVPEPTGNIIEPANGDNVVAVGSFKTKSFSGSAVPQAISSFSSFGPTRDGRLKPDVAAPGEYLYSTRSLDAPSRNYAGIVNTYYAIDAGTSMATPHATGVAALVWQSNPSLTGAQMRERLRRTANLPTDGSTPPNITWGYGKLNALRAVQRSVSSISGAARATPGVPVSLTSENSSAAFAGNSLSYVWSLAGKPIGSTASLAAVTPTASFTPDIPGDYTVQLAVSQTSPANTPQGVSTVVVHANHLPVAGFTVPAADNAGLSVTFRGTSSDADGQTLAYHWVLVSRPVGSAASITAANVVNAVFTPDAEGTYEIGLRADDGLDNSALAVQSYTTLNATTPPPASGGGGGGGGGCLIVTRSGGDASFGTPLFSFGILLLPACALGMRRFFRRQERSGPAPPLLGKGETRWRER